MLWSNYKGREHGKYSENDSFAESMGNDKERISGNDVDSLGGDKGCARRNRQVKMKRRRGVA